MNTDDYAELHSYNNATIIWENFVMVVHIELLKLTLIKIGYNRFIAWKVSLGLKDYFNNLFSVTYTPQQITGDCKGFY